MKVDNSDLGDGILSLTFAPILLLSGYTVIFLAFVSRVSIIHLWQQQKGHIIVGWGLFLVALILYVITLEPTASLWDCAEFIASAYRLQVPHPPGAPLFLLVGRVFSFFALGEQEAVAYWINMISAISSALTIMFIYWILIMLSEIIQPKLKKSIKVAGAIIGALILAFSDSFWFSAVEAETYALATLFLVAVFLGCP